MTSSRDRLTIAGALALPGDKSISHRALMLAALAEGRSRVRGLLQSDDIASTARVLRTLGVAVPGLAPSIELVGRGLAPSRLPEAPLLDCGNSGTTARLMMGIVSAWPVATTFTGDASLSRRPMRRVARPLVAMGARVEFRGDADGLPLTVHGGSLRSIAWTLEAASAQLKSAVLLAGLVGGVPVAVIEPHRTRDHTERMLEHQGVTLRSHEGRVELEPVDRLDPLDIDVPGDPSAAAFFAGLAALANAGELRLRRVALNPTRTGFVDVLRRMGVDVQVVERDDAGAEPFGDLLVRPGELRGTVIEGGEVPRLIDELPLLACVAARAEGETVIRGAGELRLKESDRIATVVANLRAAGADADELSDGIVVRGHRRALAGMVRTHGDHRLAMAFGVLGASPGTSITVDDPSCVAVSYPGFWEDLARVTA